MVRLKNVQPIEKEVLEEIGLNWHTDSDGTEYIAKELVVVSSDEANAYYEAANSVYDMYVKAAEHVIENDLFFDLGIPFNLVDTIKKSWESDVHWHLYGRFDFSGGIDGAPIKLIEFNADTPTGLFETAILQWALLKANNLDEEKQFNNVYDAIKDNFKRLIMMFDDVEDFEKHYDGWKILFSSIEGNDEEEVTTKLLQTIAKDAGYETEFAFLDEVGFDENGIYDQNETAYEYWFKLFAWEDLATDEPDLTIMLDTIMQNQKAIILNPAYTLLFQSKGMLKILWELFPDSPYLLEASFEPLKNKAYVEKRMFGREGLNTKIVDKDGSIIEELDGEYAHHKAIYQEYVEFVEDQDGDCYQAGIFFAYEACGLGYRRGGKIINNMSKFVGHIIE
ncbi:MAG: glutathionylspermidine synthase family protein [Thiovulaceae bacterium]|nr:glutathionylspermidine synthase family protein [Sulfurimonadaceae bacterium]